MSGTARIGGGINGMHLTNTKDGEGRNTIGTRSESMGLGPNGTGGRSTVKFAHTVGVGPNPGGDGDKISANASMRRKRPLNGPGDAR